MIVQYTPGETLVHRLDPRSKLAFQFGFAIAAFASTDPRWQAAVMALAVGCLWTAGLSVRRVLRTYWIVLAFLGLLVLVSGLTIGSPWFRRGQALDSLLAVGRVVPILFVSAAFVYATPVRDTRAAIQQTIPGRFGRLLGVGVGLTFRFLPVIRRDVTRLREAIKARGGDARPFHDRVGRLALLATGRAISRSETLSLALQARCFAWNPTLPALRYRFADYAVLGVALALALAPLPHWWL